ncbi:flagellar hook basal-body protein [Thermodesulfovibrionales bacterium]|nr:flagellar hook basal-body protein [Thermodesulfovibrionales bacterium]MCL0033335.1 flagellar hook basal-body protein [Thermodesulfovibrionales bacterium]
MYKGIYVSLTGAVLRRHEMDNIANNLANVNTTGFKRTTFSSRMYPILEGIPRVHDSMFPGSRVMTFFREQHIDTAQGTLRMTGNPFDLAVKGEGFFVVEGAEMAYYTRNGTFSMDREGFLVTQKGQRVLDINNMPVMVGGGVDINITYDGSINIDGEVVGRLKLVMVNNIQPVGNSLFRGDEAGEAAGAIIQGSIEASNVNPIRELVGIITALRQYEAARRMIQSFDELARQAATEIARMPA